MFHSAEEDAGDYRGDALGEARSAPESTSRAVEPLVRALALDPQSVDAARRLGDAYMQLGESAAALPVYRQAIEAGADDPEVFAALGHALLDLRQPATAVPELRACLERFPAHDRAHYDLGKALFDLGCVESSVEHLRLACRSPDPAVALGALQSLAVMVPGSPEDDHASVFAVRRQLAARIPALVAPPLGADRAPGPLRVGYLSSFFHRDNWMKPVWSLISRHDRAAFEIYLLNDSPDGALAPGYTAHAEDRIVDLHAASNEEIAAALPTFDLDLLIDLNGYSAQRRLPLLKAGLARHVVEWFNMYATTAIEGVGWLIGDERVIDDSEDQYYSEEVLRVPGSYLTYEVNYPTPAVAPPPSADAGALTIGSLASIYKLTDATLDGWCAALVGSPRTRLFLKNAGLGNTSTREHLLLRFEERGVDRTRITLEGPAEHFEFLRGYERIDLALDPFPYSGGTTTSEALWQGVPVLSLRGDRWASRTSASIMAAAGLREFIAPSRDRYLQTLTDLLENAQTPARLASLRASMRSRLLESPLFDTEGFARAMETLYQRIGRGPSRHPC